jgi:hypothetical protein
MKEHGWNVTEHHHLETAWEATFEYGQGGRVIGINSEVPGATPFLLFFCLTVDSPDGRPGGNWTRLWS